MEAVFKKKAIALGIVLASAAGVVTPVQAQNDEESLMLDEVVVTARKREESLQDSPVAVSAFSAETLRESGVSTMRDLSTAVPGLSFSEQGSKATSIFIRGVGQRESNAALDPGVGVYINGIYIARTDTQLLDTVDTESVQVLRGPQGTLFGKNTTGGAMLVTTKSPNTEAFSGTLGTKLGNYGRRDAKLFLNVPLNDENLSMRLGLNSVKRDGYMKNVVDDKDFGDEDRVAATARVLWEATDTFSVDFFTYFSKQNENGAAFTCIYLNDQARLGGQQRFPGAGSDMVALQDSCNQSTLLADDDKVALNDSKFKLQNELAAITLSWDLDDIEIKSITGVGHQSDIVIEDDQDGAAVQGLQNGTITKDLMLSRAGYEVNDEERKQYSQEFNIIGSALDESLSYTVGLFYSKEEMDNTPFIQSVGPNTYANALVSPNGAPLNIGTHKFLGTESDLETETTALFAQTTYDVTDWFQVTLGGRYTTEKRERILDTYSVDWQQFANNINALNPGMGVGYTLIPGLVEGIAYGNTANFNTAYLSNPVVPLIKNVIYPGNPADLNNPLLATKYCPIGGEVCAEEDKTWSKFTPALTLSFNNLENYLDWDNLDTGMVYFTFSKGFKAGGFEPKGSSLTTFDPEEVTNYELGTKVDAFDRRLRINAALYYMDYSDIQVRVAEKGELVSDLYLYLSNAGEATIQGYELEISVLPIENLTVMATFNYTDASYDEFTTSEVESVGGIPTIVQKDRSDEPFGSTPERSGSLSVAYNIATEASGLWIPRLSAYYRDEVYVGLDYITPEFDDAYLDSYTLLSARLTWMPDDQWNITAFVDNVTDKEYYQGGFALADLLGAGTFVKGPPRMYGIEAYYEF